MSAASAEKQSDDVVLRVRGDALFVPTDNGVWLRNNSGSFSMAGAGARAAVDWLFTTIGEGYRAVDLYQQLDPARRAGVRRVVDRLIQNGFLAALDPDDVATSGDVAAAYPEQFELLAHYTCRPGQALRGALSSRIVCMGRGLLVRSLAIALTDLGFRNLGFVVPVAEQDWLAAAAERRDASNAGSEWSIEIAPDDSLLAAAGGVAGAPHELVLLAGIADEVAAVEAAVRSAGGVTGWLTVMAGRIISSPLLADEKWCSICARGWAGSADTPDGLDVRPLAAALASFQLAHRAFMRMAGIDTVEDRRFTSVDLQLPFVESHAAVAHPLCPAHGAPRALRLVASLPVDEARRTDILSAIGDEDERQEQDRIARISAMWTDRFVGPLRWVGEGALPQLPLAVSACELVLCPELAPDPRDPRADDSGLATGSYGRVCCAAIAAREARNQAVLLALASAAGTVYAAAGAPRGRLVIAAGWSWGEALYRALHQRAHASPLSGPWRVAEHDLDPGQSAVYSFLRDTLDDLVGPVTVTTAPVVGGFWRASVSAGIGVLGGAPGVDQEHACGNALLAAAAGCVELDPGRTHPTPAILAPPTSNWVGTLDGISQFDDAIDLDPFLRFAAPHAHIIGFLARDGVPA